MPRGPSQVAIPLQGGLGNQLFQLALGLALQQRSGRRVVYSDYWLRHPVPGETSRNLEISALLKPDELIVARVPRAGRATDRLLRRRVIERAANDDALARVGPRTRVVAGYFQRLEYVRRAWPNLSHRIAASDEPAQRELVKPTAEGYGALHYRLGDYLTNSKANRHHGVTSPEYFADVIRTGYERWKIVDWRVVSDDPDAALALLRSVDLPSPVRLATTATRSEWHDLAVLASARLCAISNSSFSWWAAFIGSSYRNMHVVAPRPWFSEESSPEPLLFPEGWERLERSLLTRHPDSGVPG